MKKILFMAFTFMLAVALFAFTVAGKNEPKTDLEYYWYEVTYVGNSPRIVSQSYLSHSTLNEAIGEGYGCDGEDRPCKAGFIDELEFPGGVPKTTGTEGDVAHEFMEVDPTR